MTFTGFNVPLPKYEVITPQTKLSFTLRTLTVQEEERLKGSLLTPPKITEHLNKCIFDAIIDKPKSITDFDSFLRHTTLKDRETLLYGLYHVSYEEIRNYEVTCGRCGKSYPVTVIASDTFSFKQFPEKDILKKRVPINLPITKGVKAIIKQPSMFDEITALKSLLNRPGINTDLVLETLVIDRFEQDQLEAKEPIIFSDRIDIIDAFLSLAARDKKIINKTYNDSFGQYCSELRMKVFCQHCGFEDEIEIDLVENFFRAISSAQ